MSVHLFVHRYTERHGELDRGLTFTIMAIVLVAMMTIDRIVLGAFGLWDELATCSRFSSPESYSVDMGK